MTAENARLVGRRAQAFVDYILALDSPFVSLVSATTEHGTDVVVAADRYYGTSQAVEFAQYARGVGAGLGVVAAVSDAEGLGAAVGVPVADGVDGGTATGGAWHATTTTRSSPLAPLILRMVPDPAGH